ncbi:MAG: Hpt domain-containing protein [Spirochaetales bacterium]|nr:Hpt domain-containing protein [Spirochaetales bacterium]
MFSRKGKGQKGVSFKLQFNLFFIFFAVALYSVILITALQQFTGITETISARLGIPIAIQAADLIDGDAFERLSQTLDIQDPYYEQTRLELWAKKESSGCLYLYTMAPVSDTVYRYIIDGSAPIEDPNDFSPLGTEEDISNYSQYVKQTMETQTPQSSRIDYSPEWGWVITAYAPIINSKGESVGFAGCDFRAENVYQQLWSRLLRQLAVSLVFMILGLIGHRYLVSRVDNMMDSIQKGSIEIKEYLNILENVSDGLFLLDSSLRIGPYYSTSLETIFNRKNLAGADINEILNSFLDKKSQMAAEEFFDAAFKSNIGWRYVSRLNPLKEIIAYFDNQDGGFTERHLQFDFRRLGDKKVERLFVVVHDTTEQKKLTEEVEKTRNENRHEMEMLQNILHVDPNTLLAFLESAKQDSDAINEGLRSAEQLTSGASPDYHILLNTIFRHSHSLKGDAELLDLAFLADQAEDLEQKVMAIRDAKNPTGEDFLPLTLSFSGLLSILETLNTIITKWFRLSDTFWGAGGGEINFLRDSLTKMALRLAARYGKEVDLIIAGLEDQNFKPDKHKAIRDILVQLVRNSVYHGIEMPEARKLSGKNECGRIEIQASITADNLRIVCRDDGGGIDGEAIKNQAIQGGIIAKEAAETMNEREKIMLIFHPGFSTAESSDLTAGKGVGLSLVKSRVKELRGKFSIKSRKGHYTEFILTFPLEGLINRAKTINATVS